MLKKIHRLTASKDFGLLSTQGRSAFGPYATMRVRRSKEPGPKIAFITSTKIWKRAVDRNRIKRRLRAIFRALLPDIPRDAHLLFIVKPDASKAKHAALVEEMARLIGKIPETLAKPASLSPRAKRLQEKRKAKTS